MQRKTGRPSGTDGSDFSYRMVVDSRYTKVAKGKSRLSSLIITQAVIQLLGALNIIYSISKEESLDVLAISSNFIGFFTLLIGEIGRKRSRVNLLKFYMFLSSVGMLISFACVLKSDLSIKTLDEPSYFIEDSVSQSVTPCSSKIVALSNTLDLKLLESVQVIHNPNGWKTKISELFSAAGLLVGLLVQILSISATSSIITNMSPPKRAT